MIQNCPELFIIGLESNSDYSGLFSIESIERRGDCEKSKGKQGRANPISTVGMNEVPEFPEITV
jgi:hypothetical protein